LTDRRFEADSASPERRRPIDICVVGHLTRDRVEAPGRRTELTGGTVYYTAMALARLQQPRVAICTRAGEDAAAALCALCREGVTVKLAPSSVTTGFINRYSAARPDHREQAVTAVADPMTSADLEGLEARWFHLGPLTAGDLSLDLIPLLSRRGRVSLDVQGMLRQVVDKRIRVSDWFAKADYLPAVSVLKASETEARLLTGTSDMALAARRIAAWGVDEVVVTLGRQGSLVLHRGRLARIAAYLPKVEADPTGCGDTYMAGYLYERLAGKDPASAGDFGAAMATCKLGRHGPFKGTLGDIQRARSCPARWPAAAA
jgi:sugar/nucleoside kinase (ribokinase family)